MNGPELFLLGRTLMKIGEESMVRAGYRQLPVSIRCVLTDVFANPGSSVGEIATRTGFPQSHVSSTVAKLRESGTFQTEADPADRRRTLVRISPEVREKYRSRKRDSAPIDEALAEALSLEDAGELEEIMGLIQQLGDRISPSILARIRGKLTEETGVVG